MESERLLIRESTFDDCEYFAYWEQQPHVTEFFTINKGRNYEEVTREFINRQGDKSKMQLTICVKPENKPIGRIYISDIDYNYEGLDITRIYIADKDMRGKGYGEEALRRILKFAFEELNFERVSLDHFTANKIAANLYLKTGFQYEGIMRHKGKKNGKYFDLHLMSILKEDYFKNLSK